MRRMNRRVNRGMSASRAVCGMLALSSACVAVGAGWDDLSLGVDAGVSYIPQLRIKDVVPSGGAGGLPHEKRAAVGIGSFGSEDVSVDLDAGYALNLKLGMQLNDMAAIELEAGYAHNDFAGFNSGEWTLPGVQVGVLGGSGDLTQYPIFLNARLELPLATHGSGAAAGDMKLRLGAGIGLVGVDGHLSNIGFDDPLLSGLTATVDGGSWEPGAQFMAGLAWELAPRVELGIGYRLMVVSGANLGKATFSDPTVLGLADIETEAIVTHAVQATLSFEF